MIVITVELDSARGPRHDRHLGKMIISNDGTGTSTTGHYNVTVYAAGSQKRVVKRARVENFPQTQVGMELDLPSVDRCRSTG